MISRRPVVNSRLHVAAYILQSGHRHDAGYELKTPLWSAELFDDFPLERLVGKRQTFFPFSPTLLASPPPLSRQQSVIWVSDSVNIDATLLHSIMLLRTKGYSIALDDFVLNAETESLVAYADIISMNVSQVSDEQLAETIEYVSLFGITLMAKHVKDYAMFDRCKTRGFELFEGDFLTTSSNNTTALSESNKRVLVDTISALHDANAPLDKIERVLSRDRQLSQKVLNIVNSAATGIVREVESLRQAIMLIGLDKLKNIANVLILSNLKHKPHELTVIALTRAHMCESLALTLNNRARSDSYFTVGLASTLSAFLDEPLSKILPIIGLEMPTVNAIMEGSGNEGKLLSIVKAYEQAEWHLLDWHYLDTHQLDIATINRCYLESLEWVSTMMQNLGVNNEH